MLLFGFQLSQSLRPFSSIERAPESQLEVQVPADLQVASQPDDSKYYVGSEGPDHPTSSPPDQSDRFNQPQGAKKLGRLKVFWVLSIITVICLALAVGGGLGAGLHKSNSSRSPHLLPLVPLSSLSSLLTSFLYLVTRLLPVQGQATYPLLLHNPVIHPLLLHRPVIHLLPSYKSVTSTLPATALPNNLILLHISPLQSIQLLPPLLRPLSVSSAP